MNAAVVVISAGMSIILFCAFMMRRVKQPARASRLIVAGWLGAAVAAVGWLMLLASMFLG